MAYSVLQSSPLLPNVSPVEIYYLEEGAGSSKEGAGAPSDGEGVPILFLHGGWGYEMYPYDRQIAALSQEYRCITPDRSGYGRSQRLVGELPADFHYRAAVETLSFMDSLGIERAVLWGHSDGAVIAAIIGFTAPHRVSGLILEAIHYYAQKLSSREFFEALAFRPESLGVELRNRFALALGPDWRGLITTHSRAWLQLARNMNGPRDDLYGGRLHEITAPTLIIHGRLDPRTEPGELDDVRRQLPHAEMHILDEGSHSPHSESATAELITGIARGFLGKK
ncbi:MAG: alpha/beta fold hydrolase [Pyrinomonadaceae bacterium]